MRNMRTILVFQINGWLQPEDEPEQLDQLSRPIGLLSEKLQPHQHLLDNHEEHFRNIDSVEPPLTSPEDVEPDYPASEHSTSPPVFKRVRYLLNSITQKVSTVVYLA